MNTYQRLIALLFALVFSIGLNAQAHPLVITTLDSEGDGVELAAVQINLPDGRVLAGGYTDTLGQIAFSITPPAGENELRLQVAMVGFQRYDTLLNASDLPTNISIQLDGGQTLTTVEVVERRQLTTATLDGLNFRTNGSTEFGASGYEVLQNVPGVSVENGLEVFGRTGVVYVNGKPSKVPASQIGQFLKSKSARNIAEIEVVSQPGAGFSSNLEGTIINIVTTPKTGSGFDANGYGTLERRSRDWSQFAGVELNTYSPRFSSTLNVNGSLSNRFSVTRSTQLFRGNAGPDRSVANVRQGRAASEGITSQFDAEYRLSSATTLVTGLTYNHYLQDNNNEARSQFLGFSGTTADSSILFVANPLGDSRLFSGNIGLVSTLDSAGKKKVIFDLEIDRSDRSDADRQETSFLHDGDTGIPVANRRQQTNANEVIYGGSLRYQDQSRSKNHYNYGIGFNASNIDQDFSQSFTDLITDTQQSTSDELRYDETILHLFGENRRKLWGMTVRMGLRVEYSDIVSRSLASETTAKQTYLSLFPNFSFGKRIKEKHFLSVAYRRSIVRPTFSQLTPFNYFDSNNYFFTGNPFLLPYFRNRISLNAQLAGNVYVSASYSRANDRIVEVDLPQADGATFAGQKLNNGFGEQYQLSISHGRSLSKKIRMNFGVTATRGLEVTDLEIGPQANRFVSGSGYLNVNFSITPRWAVATNGYYSTAVTRGTTRAFDFGYLGGNITYRGKDDRFSVKLSGRDLLLTGINRSRIVYDSAERFIRNNWDSRIYSVTVSFNVARVNNPTRRNQNISTANEQLRKRLSE